MAAKGRPIPNMSAVLHVAEDALSGDDLTDEDATIDHAGYHIRTLPEGTLTANRTLTLGQNTTDKVNWVWLIRRLDQEAFTLTVVDGVTGNNIALLDASIAQTVAFILAPSGWIQLGALPIL